MRQYTDAIRQALAHQNWLAALTIALSLPDICGGLETPAQDNSKKRSIRWFDENMLRYYKKEMPVVPEPRSIPFVLKTGADQEEIRLHMTAKTQHRKERKGQQAVATEPMIFLSGSDCFALRCALLHEGSDQTDRQRAKEVIDSFLFVVHTGKISFHLNKSGSALQIDLELFCNQIGDAVDAWAVKVANDPEIQGEITRLLKIIYL